MARACDDCRGTGYGKCTNCDGSDAECEQCGGKGFDPSTTCSTCDGTRLWHFPRGMEGEEAEDESES
jgi:hypothetical protein